MKSLLLTLLVALTSCASMKDPAHFMKSSFKAKSDSARHLRALDQLCDRDLASKDPGFEFCIEAIRVQESTGKKAEATQRAGILCQRGSAEACLTWTRHASADDSRLARETLTRSCNEDPAYCLHSARLEQRLGSSAEAMKRARKGCVAGFALACRDQGLLAIQQDDLRSASVALAKACDSEIEPACFEKALVARMSGKEVPGQMERLCQSKTHPLACDLLEVDTLKSLDKDWLSKAERSCKKEGGEICYRVSLDQYFRPGGRSLAKFRFKNDCANSIENAASCFMARWISRPFGFEKEDEPELKRLCELGSKASCFELGQIQPLPTVSVSKVAPENLESSCEVDQRPESCEEKARILYQAGDVRGAERFMVNACKLGNEDACAWVASRALEQEPRDLARGREFHRKACLSGSVAGCEGLVGLEN